MAETLQVEKRKQTGKLNNRRLRRSGHVPAVLYGHGEEVVMLTLPAEELETTLRHGAKVVELGGAASGQALLQEVHWDTFQHHVLHVDLLRVDASERVVVEVPVHLRGEAPGEREGGVVEHLIHFVEIETSPVAIPESLHIKINQLQLHGTLTLADIIDLPEGATLVTDAKLVAVQCVEPAVEAEEEELGAGAGAEPEIIGRKPSDDEEAEES